VKSSRLCSKRYQGKPRQTRPESEFTADNSSEAPGSCTPVGEYGREWLERAFATHKTELQSFILRKMGSLEEAEELTQDLFVRLMAYNRPEQIDNLQAFLFTTAGNIVRDRIRRLHARRHNFHDQLDKQEIDSGMSLEHSLDAQQRAEITIGALSELEDEYRRALTLHRLESWTHAQIAEELGTTVGVVRRYISVASDYCKQKVVDASMPCEQASYAA